LRHNDGRDNRFSRRGLQLKPNNAVIYPKRTRGDDETGTRLHDKHSENKHLSNTYTACLDNWTNITRAYKTKITVTRIRITTSVQVPAKSYCDCENTKNIIINVTVSRSVRRWYNRKKRLVYTRVLNLKTTRTITRCAFRTEPIFRPFVRWGRFFFRRLRVEEPLAPIARDIYSRGNR